MTATILVADDDRAVRLVVSEALTRQGYKVKTTGSAATLWNWILDGEGDLVLTDVYLPDDNGLDLIPRIRRRRPQMSVIAMSAQNTMATAVKASEKGAFEYIAKPFDLDILLRSIERALSLSMQDKETAGQDISSSDALGAEMSLLVGRSPIMQKIYRTLSRISQSDLPILITGAAGTGKKTLARVIHDHSRRMQSPFAMVTISTLNGNLAEDLFGTVERGGRINAAGAGTLVLSDIADLTKGLQHSLLDCLETGEYQPLGSRRRLRFEPRLISISSSDSHSLLDDEKLRAELFYRLGVVTIHMPTLKERLEDIPELAVHILRKLSQQGLAKCRIKTEAQKRLQEYDWPGNVRELENILRNLCILSTDHTIDADMVEQVLSRQGIVSRTTSAPTPVMLNAVRDGQEALGHQTLSQSVEQHLKTYFSAHNGKLPPAGLYDRILAEIERPLIDLCLKNCQGNQIKAAELLGLNRNTLRKKIRDLDITVRRGGIDINLVKVA